MKNYYTQRNFELTVLLLLQLLLYDPHLASNNIKSLNNPQAFVRNFSKYLILVRVRNRALVTRRTPVQAAVRIHRKAIRIVQRWPR